MSSLEFMVCWLLLKYKSLKEEQEKEHLAFQEREKARDAQDEFWRLALTPYNALSEEDRVKRSLTPYIGIVSEESYPITPTTAPPRLYVVNGGKR